MAGAAACATLPAVLTVRAVLRGAKSGRVRPGPALLTSALALAAGLWLVSLRLAPPLAAAALGLLAIRAWILLVFPRPPLRARTLGMIEALLGLLLVAGVGWAWRE